jgi:hypothetical protein
MVYGNNPFAEKVYELSKNFLHSSSKSRACSIETKGLGECSNFIGRVWETLLTEGFPDIISLKQLRVTGKGH